MFVRLKLYAIVSRVAAAVLLLAAALKFWPVLTDSSSQESPWTTVALASVELLLGVWLLSGRAPRWGRIAALGCFAVFFNFSLLQVLQRVPSCGCFGKAQVQATAVAALDFLMVLALLASSPGHWLRLLLGLFSIAGVIVLFGWQMLLAVSAAYASSSAPVSRGPLIWKSPIVQTVIQGVQRNYADVHSLKATLDVSLTTFSNSPNPPGETKDKDELSPKAKAVPQTNRIVMQTILRGDDLRRDCDSHRGDVDVREIRVESGDKRILYQSELQQAWLTVPTVRELSGSETIDLRCAGFHPPIRSIADWLKKAEVVDSSSSKDAKAGEVVHLRVLTSVMGGANEEVALDCAVATNYLPTRIVYRFQPDGSIFTVIDLQYQFMEEGKAWLPKKWKSRSFLRGTIKSADATSGFDLLAETQVRSLSVNGEVSDEVFDPILPPHTRLVGNLASQPRTGSEPIRASTAMNRQPNKSIAPSSQPASPFFWLLAVIDAAALSLFLAYRRQLVL
jgi:hypothetical protein